MIFAICPFPNAQCNKNWQCSYELYQKMRKKSKPIGGLLLLRSVGDESVDILFIMRDNGKSLPDEFVGDCDHGELSGLSVLPEPRVSLFALSIKPAGRPRSNVKESSGVCISIPVDVSSDIYGRSGLFVSRTDTKIPGYLFGILEVSEPAGGDNERCRERYAYSLNGGQQCKLSAELGLDKVREFRLEPVSSLFKELDSFIDGMDRTLVRHRKTNERLPEVRHGGELLGNLPYDRSFLTEPQNGLALHLERLRIHLLPIQGYEPCVDFVGLDRGEHGSGKVLYLQRVLHANGNPGDIEHVQQQGTVVPGRFHDTVDTTVFGESSDELPNPCGPVIKSTDLTAFVGGVSHHECSLTHVDSNVLHGRSVFSFNDIAYILVHHCEYGFKHLTNYPDSDVKSMGSEHSFRSRKPMTIRTYSIL